MDKPIPIFAKPKTKQSLTEKFRLNKPIQSQQPFLGIPLNLQDDQSQYKLKKQKRESQLFSENIFMNHQPQNNNNNEMKGEINLDSDNKQKHEEEKQQAKASSHTENRQKKEKEDPKKVLPLTKQNLAKIQNRRASVNPELLGGHRRKQSIEQVQLHQLQQLQQYHKNQQKLIELKQNQLITGGNLNNNQLITQQVQNQRRTSLNPDLLLKQQNPKKRRQSIQNEIKQRRRASLNTNQLIGQFNKGGAINQQQQKQLLLQMQQQLQQQAIPEKQRKEGKSLTSHGIEKAQQNANGVVEARKLSILNGGKQPKPLQKILPLYYDKINEGFSLESQDQPIQLQTIINNSLIEAESAIEFKVKSRQKILRMRKKKKRIIPTIIQIDINEPGQQKFGRKGIDLAIVVDAGQTMKGKKIAICREILFLLLDLLDQRDRISFIKQDHQGTILCPFLQVSKENQPYLRKLIYQYFSKCSKEEKTFDQGMQQAYSMISKRKHINNITKILVLSDGKLSEENQNRALSIIKDGASQISQVEYAISVLGIQKEANDTFLNTISNIKPGGKYIRINHFPQIYSSLESIMSDVLQKIGKDVLVNLELKQNKEPFNQLEVRKTYGYEWNKINEQTYQVKVGQLYRGIPKVFAFDLSLPGITYTLSEGEKNQILLKANLQLQSEKDEIVNKDTQLVMNFVNEDEGGDNIREDSDVMEQYFIKKMRDSISSSLDMMFKGEQQKGIENLQTSYLEIHSHIESSNIKQIFSEYILRELGEIQSLFQKSKN